MRRRDFLAFLLSTPLAATIDYDKLFWVKEKTIFLPSIVPIAFDYNIAIPLLYGVVASDDYYGIDKSDAKYKLINRAEAIKWGILIKGPGLEDIDRYIRDMQALKGK